MKDFDEARSLRVEQDRGFKLGGEVFIRRASVRPEATEPWESVSLESTQKETLGAIDETIMNLIEPGEKTEAHKRWMKLRTRDEDAVTLGDLLELVQWLVAEQAGRPTEPLSNFSDEPDTSGTTSTGGSPSPDTPEESTG